MSFYLYFCGVNLYCLPGRGGRRVQCSGDTVSGYQTIGLQPIVNRSMCAYYRHHRPASDLGRTTRLPCLEGSTLVAGDMVSGYGCDHSVMDTPRVMVMDGPPACLEGSTMVAGNMVSGYECGNFSCWLEASTK